MTEVLFFPTSISYEVGGNQTVVYLHGIDENRVARVITLMGTKPRFWTDDPNQDHHFQRSFKENVAVDFWGKSLNEVEVDYPFNMSHVRSAYLNTYEADIYHERRVRYDFNIRNCVYVDVDAKYITSLRPADPHINIEPRIWTLDIETYYTETGANGQYPTDKVISIAIHDSLADKYIVILNGELTDEERLEFEWRCNDEKPELTDKYKDVKWDVRISTCASEMLMFLELHRLMDRLQPQIIRGWNFCSSGKYNEGFDWPYMKNRAENLGFPFPDERRFQIWDSMEAYARVHTRAEGQPKDGKGLNAVAVNEGIGHKMEHQGIAKMYDEDRVSLLYYNVMDVFLNKTISETAFGGTDNFYLNLAREAGCSLTDTVSEMRMIDAYVTHWLAENRPTVKQPTNASTADHDVVGGLVLKPAEKGIHGPAAEIDLSQAYTAAIRSCNFSPETKVRGKIDPSRSFITMPSGRKYYTDIKGIFPSILDGLSEKMNNLKREGRHQERQATKSINHSFYGNTKNKYYRNRDVDIAEDILEIVRTQAQYNADLATGDGATVLYGDTDSIYITVPGLSIDELEVRSAEISDHINESYGEWVKQWGLTNHHFAVDYEDSYESIIFTMKKSGDGEAKKRYAALKRNGELKVRGFDFRRSDRSAFARRTQYEVLKMILTTRDPLSVRRYVQDVQEGLKTGRYPMSELAIPKGLGSPISKYMDSKGMPVKGCPQHYRAAIYSNSCLGTSFDWGDKVYLYHGHINGKPRTKIFALPWGESPPPEARIDLDEHVRLIFKSPLEPILDALGLSWEDATTTAMATTLGDF